MRELKNIEERILDRALYLMGKNKSCNIAIRAIAKEANVNVSAINYYFRSKDEMLKLVKEFYIENTLAVLSILQMKPTVKKRNCCYLQMR
ncbi:TetR family transcriptional regulator [Paenibacillus sp. DMB5]|uniref:TetR/AcrR family transcriptional regulator n=1 Tax=Paenibacillus sp. DMB5 TaxID=1780103 RepID=UPI000A8E68B5|nr:TetR family transcriptional regulator [Paenibacillus sp. DMB5]